MLKTTEEINTMQFIGMLMEDAEKLANDLGLTVRIISLDGDHAMVTTDYRSARVNFDIDRGVVIGSHIG